MERRSEVGRRKREEEDEGDKGLSRKRRKGGRARMTEELGNVPRLRMKGCDRTQMGFTECLIHKSSLLSLSLGALDALPTEEADRFTNVSVINCGFYFDPSADR